ncbi:transporter substrate-binding domain-containing protein [Sphaerisporangium sp. NPDC088356]|uniref:transporter substrate-binding domain-containing protein n=1 Tax=Sphaerisporangium sp. NPDC088356 TaxID=3154871 RepID=UPI0034414C49
MSRTPPAAPPPAPIRGRPLAMALLTLATVLTGCGGGHGTLVVGVRPERPGLAVRLPAGGYAGFEIDVAGYVARRLGYRDDQVSYVELGPDPAGARVDLTMGVPPAKNRAAGGPLSGPYLVSGQDILTAANDLSIRRLKDLTQKRVCTGSPVPLVARFGVAWQRAFLITSTVEDCVRMLAAHRVQAVTDDAVVLAGLADASPGAFRLVGHTFSRDKYGIALREDSGDLHTQVDDALRSMFDDGTWRRAVIEHLGLLAAKYTTPPALEKYSRTRSAP